MKKTFDLRKTLIVLLSTLCLVFAGFSVGVSGVFALEASDIAPEEGQFEMLDGAEVNLTGNYGLRFTTEITEEYYAELQNAGTVRLYTSIGPLGFTALQDEWTEDLVFTDGVAKFYGVMNYGKLTDKEVKERAAVELTGRAYAEVTCPDGKVLTVEATRKDTTRSMRGVANMALVEEDYGESDSAKEALKRYLGRITREEERGVINSNNTVVNFSKKVNGRVFLNGVRTNIILNKATSVDIGAYLDFTKLDISNGIVVSVMGDNGYSVYDVVSKTVDYEIEIIYTDEKTGLAKTDYNILCSSQLNTYVPARHMVEMFERATGVLDIISYSSTYDKATLGGKHIVIGVRNDLFRASGLPYDNKEFLTGGYAIATIGNTIFLYGGDETYSDSRGDGCHGAVNHFLNELFNYEVTGIVPKGIQDINPAKYDKNGNVTTPEHELYEQWGIDGLDVEKHSWNYTHDLSIFTLDENVKQRSFAIRTHAEFYPAFAGRSSNYGTYNNDLKEALKMNGNQGENGLRTYTVVYEEYLKIAEKLAQRAWRCDSGHYQYSETKPTACKTSSCETPNTIIDATMTVEAYKKHTAYKCLSCGRHSVAFTNPGECNGNYNIVVNGQADNGCTSTSLESHTSASWHNASYHFPIQNHIHDHPLWYGEASVYACNNISCRASFNYSDYYNLTTGEPLAAANRTCKTCNAGVITKFYATSAYEIKCNSCGTSASKVNITCTTCSAGTTVYIPNSTTPSTNENPNYSAMVNAVSGYNSAGSYLRQPCYNAHGNEAEYKAMVRESLEKCLNNLKYADYQDLANAFYNTVVDGTAHCQCDACIKEFILYSGVNNSNEVWGTMAGSIIEFINDVNKLIDAWMQGNKTAFTEFFGYAENSAEMKALWQKKVYDTSTGTISTVDIDLAETWTDANGNVYNSYVKETVQYFFAYVHGASTKTNCDKWAPVEWDSETNKWVAVDASVKMYDGTYASTGVYLVTASDNIAKLPKTNANGELIDENGNVVTSLDKAAYYTYEEIQNGAYTFNGIENENVFKYLAEESSVRLNLKQWSDISEGTEMYLWINTQASNITTVPYYSANLADQDFFKFLQECGTNNLFCYASSAESNAITAFNNLKLYVTAKRSWNAEEDLATLYDTWFKSTFVDEEIIAIMEGAFEKEMSMAVKANYLVNNSGEHPDYDISDVENNPFLVGNSQSYTSYAGPNGEYWDVNELIELFNTFSNANDLVDKKFGGYTQEQIGKGDRNAIAMKMKHIKVKSMIYSEWYFPVAYLARYYFNSPEVLAIDGFTDTIASTLKEIIDITGIKYNAEYGAPTSPDSDMIYYGTQLEVVIFDYTNNGSLKSGITSNSAEVLAKLGEEYILPKNDNGQIVDTISINGTNKEVVVYDPATGELTLFEGEIYRVLLKVTQDLYNRNGKVIYPAGTYITPNSAYSSGYYGAQKIANTTANYYGEHSMEWPSDYTISRSSSIIRHEENKTSQMDISSKRALAQGKFDSTLNRTVAKETDLLNIYVGMGVTNWCWQNIYSIRITLVGANGKTPTQYAN